jgi:SPP1 family predicted phage head-tail adaptor
MKAGSLDRVILIERPNAPTSDVFGVKTQTWTTVATMRAQKLSNAIIDREGGARGDTTDDTITFRTRWLNGVTLENRVTYQGQPFKIIAIKELGRHIGLDITCERVGP